MRVSTQQRRESDDDATGGAGAGVAMPSPQAPAHERMAIEDARELKRIADLGGARGFVVARGVATTTLTRLRKEGRIDTLRDDCGNKDKVKLTARGQQDMLIALAAAPAVSTR